jgi:hypothetical protein
MKIIVTETQLKYLVENVESTNNTKDDCLPEKITEWNEVDYSIKDVKGGKILNYGDKDTKNGNALKKIQKKLGIGVDGEYGVGTLKALAKELDIDLCKQKDYNIPIGPNSIKKLGIKENLVITKENREDYILASTLVIENFNASNTELFAILSSIKNRANTCNKSMEHMVLIPKQYSTWDYYNKLDKEGKKKELKERLENHIENKNLDKFLKVVKDFKGSGSLTKVNHYFTKELAKKADNMELNSPIAKSYRKNKKSIQRIGDHVFWWDSSHRCN